MKICYLKTECRSWLKQPMQNQHDFDNDLSSRILQRHSPWDICVFLSPLRRAGRYTLHSSLLSRKQHLFIKVDRGKNFAKLVFEAKLGSSNVTRAFSSTSSIYLGILELSMQTTCLTHLDAVTKG